jgi:excisionase family DNA binding protein
MSDAGVVDDPVREPPDGLLDEGAKGIPDALAFLGIKKSQLYALMEAGELPYCTVGRRRLIPVVGMKRLLAAGLKR